MSLRAILLATAALAGIAGAARSEEVLPARLAGYAVVPALTLVLPPEDAPRDALVSGKFTGAARVDAPYSAPATTSPAQGGRATGLSLPFIGQAFQGLSGLAHNRAPDGSFYLLTDNGFGAKANSGDALLMFHRVAPDWAAAAIDRRETVFLRDPDRVVPFRIANEATEARYLTGADFDPESIQVIGDTVWIGDEFGPYLIRATLDGRVTGVYPTLVEGAEVRSPDNPAVRVPAAAGVDYRSQRSGGFEGMALNPATGMLWALLEKPLLGADGEPEGAFLRVLEFDPAAAEWTGRGLRFPLGEGAVAIGDFNFIDETRALIIERDAGEGDAARACADPGQPAADCFANPARVKRIVLTDVAKADAEGALPRLAHVDLMAIADPDGKGGPAGGTFTFPFETIENVARVDDTHILVINDNNLPFSTGRETDRAADNEFLLLSVPELLNFQPDS
ncbi:MAG: hypothetical protein DI556_07450 [Rhodovulum sulfidophilum]|uniref:Phytase-like domain-containing protein n=1 Tax=Rhodovulum sulfidophilum TaxID=35806 RepID=A0A2W5NA63_RHOSU|nr:MAG: hypothetical protein DI556_07450 [Rhodovulum sulfidophilum]